MLCALTVRNLKPGTADQFMQAFIPEDDTNVPEGWKQFFALKNVGNQDQVITFGFFDGTIEELRAGQQNNDAEYEQRRAAIDEFVESVGADGVFEIVEERSMH